MAHIENGKFAAFAPVDSDASVPIRIPVSTTSASHSSLAAGLYWVRLNTVSVVYVKSGGAAAIPASGAATSGNVSLAHGETYHHKATADLHAIALSSGDLILQPISNPG